MYEMTSSCAFLVTLIGFITCWQFVNPAAPGCYQHNDAPWGNKYRSANRHDCRDW